MRSNRPRKTRWTASGAVQEPATKPALGRSHDAYATFYVALAFAGMLFFLGRARIESDWVGWTGAGIALVALIAAVHYFKRAYGFSSQGIDELPEERSLPRLCVSSSLCSTSLVHFMLSTSMRVSLATPLLVWHWQALWSGHFAPRWAKPRRQPQRSTPKPKQVLIALALLASFLNLRMLLKTHILRITLHPPNHTDGHAWLPFSESWLRGMSELERMRIRSG